MSSSSIPFFKQPYLIPAGFHIHDPEGVYSPILLTEGKENLRNLYIWHNLTTFLSWIPLLSIISGICNVRFARKLDEFAARSEEIDSEKEYMHTIANCYRARAIASFCQATVFLMIVDLITTTGRFAPSCKQN